MTCPSVRPVIVSRDPTGDYGHPPEYSGRACPSEGAKVKANVGPDAGASNRAARAEMLPQRLGQEPIEHNNPRDAPTVRITVIRVAPSDENPSQICSEFTSPPTTR